MSVFALAAVLGCGPGEAVVESDDQGDVDSTLTYAGFREWPTFVETAPVVVDQVLATAPYANHPDGDTPGIQAAIETCVRRAGATSNGHCTVRFTAGKTYHMTRTAPGGHGIVLAGKRVTLEGNGATIFNATTTNHNWGDTLDIVGLRYGFNYPRYAGTSSPKHLAAPMLTEFIEVRNLIIKHDPKLAASLPYRNCIGIVHVRGVRLTNVQCHDAHQTSFAVVSVTDDGPNGVPYNTQVLDLTLDRVHAIRSGQHAYRFHLQDQARDLEVRLKDSTSRAVAVAHTPTSVRELGERGVHLWYRASHANSQTGHATLRIEGSTFDSSGEVVVTQGLGSAFVLINTKIYGGLDACVGAAGPVRPTVSFDGASFACTVSRVIPEGASVLDTCLRASVPHPPAKTSVVLHGVTGQARNTRWLTPGASASSCITAVGGHLTQL